MSSSKTQNTKNSTDPLTRFKKIKFIFKQDFLYANTLDNKFKPSIVIGEFISPNHNMWQSMQFIYNQVFKRVYLRVGTYNKVDGWNTISVYNIFDDEKNKPIKDVFVGRGNHSSIHADLIFENGVPFLTPIRDYTKKYPIMTQIEARLMWHSIMKINPAIKIPNTEIEGA